MDKDNEKIARMVAACEKAGIDFRVVDGRLIVTFDKLDWRAWPELKLMLEELEGASLLSFLETHAEFKKARSRRAWSLVSRKDQPLKTAHFGERKSRK